jgi:hypothetical protein
MKTITLTILNDSTNEPINAFTLAAKFLDIKFTIVSPSNSAIVDVSVKYNNDAELFVLGSTYTLYKMRKVK